MTSVFFSGIIVTPGQLVSNDDKKLVLYYVMNFFKYFSWSFYANEALFSAEMSNYMSDFGYTASMSLVQYLYSNFFYHIGGIVAQIFLTYIVAYFFLLFGYTNAFDKIKIFFSSIFCLGKIRISSKSIEENKITELKNESKFFNII